MIVADSSVWIEHFNGTPGPERDALRALIRDDPEQLLVPDLVLFEVLRGVRDERMRRLVGDALNVLRSVSTVDPEAAVRAADRYRRLRAIGVTVRSGVDVLIASYCIDHDLVLLQRDRDFLPFEQHLGLRLFQSLH